MATDSRDNTVQIVKRRVKIPLTPLKLARHSPRFLNTGVSNSWQGYRLDWRWRFFDFLLKTHTIAIPQHRQSQTVSLCRVGKCLIWSDAISAIKTKLVERFLY